MLTTEFKLLEELAEVLPPKIFVIHCYGCAEVGFSLDEAHELVDSLRECFDVTGEETADYLCRPDFTERRLELYEKELDNSDAVLIFSCGVGVQTVAELTDKPVYTGCNTLKLPGYAGLKPADLECDRCGDCVLGRTAGICPVANCAKGLINGPCGGAQDGKCEVDPDKDCAWMLIYDRLKAQGRIEQLEHIRPFRDYSKYELEFEDEREETNAV